MKWQKYRQAGEETSCNHATSKNGFRLQGSGYGHMTKYRLQSTSDPQSFHLDESGAF